MKRDILEKVQTARARKLPAALATDLKTGEQAFVTREDATGALALGDDGLAAMREAITADRSGTIDWNGRRLFVQVFNPPLRMIVVGAVHIAQALVAMATIAGYAVTVVDPRRAFATDARFPGVELTHEWPDDALARLEPDRRTAVVTLTHDPKIDDPALQAALSSDCFYIGSLGSTRTHGKRLDRLKAEGFSDAALKRIHGPIGLSIGAKSPAEIAISILAQITEALHAKEVPA
jgi:xanthine dehydrogenase accessory factor